MLGKVKNKPEKQKQPKFSKSKKQAPQPAQGFAPQSTQGFTAQPAQGFALQSTQGFAPQSAQGFTPDVNDVKNQISKLAEVSLLTYSIPTNTTLAMVVDAIGTNNVMPMVLDEYPVSYQNISFIHQMILEAADNNIPTDYVSSNASGVVNTSDKSDMEVDII